MTKKCSHTDYERRVDESYNGCILCDNEVLRGNLSLAEEGLANAMQEIGVLREELRKAVTGEICESCFEKGVADGTIRPRGSLEPCEQLEDPEMTGYINGLSRAGNMKPRVARDDNGSAVLNDIREQIDQEIAHVRAQKSDEGASRDASSEQPEPFCKKHPNTAFADTGCPFCGTPPTLRTFE